MALNTTTYKASQADSWSFRKYHLSNDRGGLNAGTFMTSEAVLIAAGPPRLADSRGQNIATAVMPIALIESASLQQSKMLQQIYEVGARRSYFVSGRVTGSMGISRPMFNGPSLLRLLAGNNGAQGLGNDTDNEPGLLPALGTSGAGTRPNEVESELWVNLGAEVFDRPLGIYMYMIDQRERPFGGMYAEDAMIQGHNLSIAAQGITIPESVQILYDRLLPVAVRGALV